MKYFRYYLPLMLRMTGTQVIISLLSNMLYVTLYDLPLLLIIGMTFALVIYFYMQYKTIWEFACRESMKPAPNQIHFGSATGLFIGLGSGLPSFLFNLVPVLFPMHVNEFGELSGGLSQLFYTLSKFFFNGQYIAIIQSFFPMQILDVQNAELAAQNGATIIASLPWYLPTVLPVGLVGWFAFYLGLKDKTLTAFLGLDKLLPKKEAKKPPTKK